MKTNLWPVLLLLAGCAGGTSERPVSAPVEPEKTYTAVTVKNPAQYAAAFLDSLDKNTFAARYAVEGERLIVDARDTFYFPTDLPLNGETVFRGLGKEASYELRVRRVNFTTLQYRLLVEGPTRPRTTVEGTADLGALFFLASEVDEDPQTGQPYGAAEYTGKTAACALVALRIGRNDEGHLLARVVTDCSPPLPDSPVLTVDGGR
jgi:hypothetical protein